MGIYSIKPKFRRALGGLARRLAGAGVTPDRVTTAGLLFALAGGAAVAAGGIWSPVFALVPVAALGRITCNALDGLVAELQGSGRPAGELYNETADRIGDLLFLLPVALLPQVSVELVLAAVAFSQIGSFIGVGAKAAGTARRYDGPMGKPDRMFVMGAAALVAIWLDPAAAAFNAAMAVVGLGGLVTAWNRFRRAQRDLEAAA